MKKRTFHFSGKPVNYYFDASFDALKKMVPVESAVIITDENVFEAVVYSLIYASKAS